MPMTWERWREARNRAEDGCERAVVLDRFRDLAESLEKRAATAARQEHREKAAAFLRILVDAEQRLGDHLYQPSYLLNVVGDALVRTSLVSEETVELLKVGLYFHGIRVIERRFAARTAGYFAAHAELIAGFFSRAAVQRLVIEGRAKIAEGKVFCLTYYYLNELKKTYWASLRNSSDALDHVVGAVETQSEPAAAEEAASIDVNDRVGLMMEIFRRKLTAEQQLVYLAKNRDGQSAAGLVAATGCMDQEFLRLLRGLDAELEGHGNLGWSEIADKLKMNEKSAKREYLRALHTLLYESAMAVFGLDIESVYVRRVLAQLREIVYEKDLRIRSNAGEGLARLVEKWEVALRFVLNHGRVVA